jgi:AAA+ superfamily predicted ATPase
LLRRVRLSQPAFKSLQLIDEVESLATNRQKSSNSDPGDAVRVVNALLTRIDRLRNYDNILILTTSNIVGSIGMYAFRACSALYKCNKARCYRLQTWRSSIVLT